MCEPVGLLPVQIIVEASLFAFTTRGCGLKEKKVKTHKARIRGENLFNILFIFCTKLDKFT